MEWPTAEESRAKRALLEEKFDEVARIESQHDGRPMLTLVYRARRGGTDNRELR